MSFSDDEIQRYQRHLVLKGFGGPGQNALKSGKVLIVGAGGLGSPVIAYLTAAGVGTLIIADDDVVSISNLQRQIIHRTADIDVAKVDSAARFSAEINPHVQVQPLKLRLNSATQLQETIAGVDVVIDCTDRFETRKDIANTAQKMERPVVSGAVNMFDGQVTVFAPHLRDDRGAPYPRFEDLYPYSPNSEELPACEDVGILGATTGVIGSLMAMEALKLLTQSGECLFGCLLMYDGRAARFTRLSYGRQT